MIQNSLDVRVNPDEPVVVRFTLDDFDRAGDDPFVELTPYFEKGQLLEKGDEGSAFYSSALEALRSGRPIRFLGIHDYNTTGLTGPVVDEPSAPQQGPWLALVKGSGATNKKDAAALGSFGHGSRAPFANTALRTLFYFSRIPGENGASFETRFQGRSILQSIPLNDITGEDSYSAAIGYFGVKEGYRPLLDEDVPEWARTFRRDDESSVGTSIYVPEPYGVDDPEHLWDEVRLAVVANFYFAVARGHLTVRIGEEDLIDSSCIKQVFDDVMERDLLSTLKATDDVKARIEAAHTLRAPEDHGVLEGVPGFGDVEWFIRLETAPSRSVGIARRTGMLISQSPEGLKRFPGLMRFDLFVCVAGHDGSALLRKVENPEHTRFEFDRITDPKLREETRNKYKNFCNAIRNLLREKASTPDTEEIEVDDLDEFFGIESGPQGAESGGEATTRLTIVGSRVPRTSKPVVPGAAGSGRIRGGSNSTPRPPRPSRPPGPIPRGGEPVRHLRVARDDSQSNGITVYFDAASRPGQRLVLFRSGERDKAPIEMVSETGELVDGAALPPSDDGVRRSIYVTVAHEADLGFAIEARLYDSGQVPKASSAAVENEWESEADDE